jgi:aminopeptidase-like protein
MKLKDGKYHVYIDSSLEDGALTYGEYIIPGETEKEILLSTYICHPSMANNELSGPVVTTFIANWLNSKPRRYTYRIIFIPETIGSITYLSKHSEELKQRVIAGFNISCIGDEGGFSYVGSRYENTYADRIADHILSSKYSEYIKYSFLDRGSDERQYCSPGIDLPLVTLCKSKFGTYPEYHTSLDNLDLVTADGLFSGYSFVKDCLKAVENNYKYKATMMCEPQLGKYNLYESGIKGASTNTRKFKNLIAYCDGQNDLLWIAEKINCSLEELLPMIDKLMKIGIIDRLPLQ